MDAITSRTAFSKVRPFAVPFLPSISAACFETRESLIVLTEIWSASSWLAKTANGEPSLLGFSNFCNSVFCAALWAVKSAKSRDAMSEICFLIPARIGESSLAVKPSICSVKLSNNSDTWDARGLSSPVRDSMIFWKSSFNFLAEPWSWSSMCFTFFLITLSVFSRLSWILTTPAPALAAPRVVVPIAITFSKNLAKSPPLSNSFWKVAATAGLANLKFLISKVEPLIFTSDFSVILFCFS